MCDFSTIPPRSPSGSGGGRWSPKQIEDKIKDFDIDKHGDDDGSSLKEPPVLDIEEPFEKIDVRFTTPPTRGDRRAITSGNHQRVSNNRHQSTGEGKEIELDG
ncbi:unnamed protein product [Strongylus vulgaris]|uniref:Uncharacterized protein n=1 Tax=Strongylus vulgaris TaxID=40348 RepID=A0A3P7JIS2_STRVU|nr:unnamed protein product [Strongylus vulgaris]